MKMKQFHNNSVVLNTKLNIIIREYIIQELHSLFYSFLHSLYIVFDRNELKAEADMNGAFFYGGEFFSPRQTTFL